MRPETPAVTVDVIIELRDRENRTIVLIERKNPPYGWAVPGGFVDVGETVSHAAVREALEETSLDVELDCLLGCYSDPSRDTRGHTVSLVYVGHATGEPVADDDALSLKLFDPYNIDVTLAFDHQRILQDYREYLETGQIQLPD